MDRKSLVVISVLLILVVCAAIAVVVLAIQLRDAKDDVKRLEKQDDIDLDTNKCDDIDLDTNKCDDIAIIGAGITGSYAAWRFRERGLKITLYEYSNRIGGRFQTVKLPGIPDVNVELGAMRFIPIKHTVLNQTVHELGLDVVDFVLGHDATSETLYYLRGQHMTHKELPTKAPYEIPDEYRYDFNTFMWHMFDNYTIKNPDVEDPLSPVNRQRIKSLDGVALGMQSRRAYDAKFFDSETVKYYSDAIPFKSESIFPCAAAWLPLSDPSQSSGPNPVKTVAQGFQAIPEKLIDQFLSASKMHSFQRNHHLKSIRKHNDGSYILSFQPTETIQGRTEDIKNLPRNTRCAKKVVLGITQMALQHLDWSVLKNDEIKDMLDNAVVGVKASKMYFGYDEPWWRNLTRAAQFAVSTTPLGMTYDFATSPTTKKAVLNPSYTDIDGQFWRDVKDTDDPVQGAIGGDMSIAMSNTSVYLARKYYAEIFGINVKDVPEPNSAVMNIWDFYPIGASWYEWQAGYIWEDVETRMMKPSQNDEVYITGNIFSSSISPGWSEGGLRLVDKLLTKL